jgi:hypothetical protein
MRLDFTGVKGQTEFTPIPAGKYDVQVTDYRQGTASDKAKNPGATTISWELTVLNGEYEGRKVWENMTLVENSLWRLKAFLEACGFDVEGEIDFDPDEVVNSELVAKVGIQRGRKDKDTGEEYDPRNTVKGFYAIGAES